MYWKGRDWFTGITRKLTDKEAEPLLEKGIIFETDLKPKRFVILNGKEMTWGEYLKMKRQKSGKIYGIPFEIKL